MVESGRQRRHQAKREGSRGLALGRGAARAQVMEAVQAVESGRRNMYDPDEIEEEQRERELRNKVRAMLTRWTRGLRSVNMRLHVASRRSRVCVCAARAGLG